MIGNFGWVPDKTSQRALAAAGQVYGRQADDLPVDMDKSFFPYRLLAQALRGSKHVNEHVLQSRNQGQHGSCVGHGTARMAAINLAADILVRKTGYEWPKVDGKPVDVSPSWLYGAGRQIVGQLGSWEGSNGSWNVKALRDWGMLFEADYGVINVSEYRESDCDKWEAGGVPAESKQFAADYKFDTFVQITNVEQWVGLIQNFYTATCCSQLGFSSTRNGGYAKRQGSWAHCMVGGLAYVAKPERGILIQNSWGNKWNSGDKHPMMPDMPEGSFVITLKDAQAMLDAEDTWTCTGGRGLVPAPPNWEDGAIV